MTVRAKFIVQSVGDGKLRMTPVTGNSAENTKWFTATPSGSIEMQVMNAEAMKQFEVGKAYYVDFAPASS